MKNSHLTKHSLHPQRQNHSHTSNTNTPIERYNTLSISDASRKWDKQTETAGNTYNEHDNENEEDVLSGMLAPSASTVSSDTNPPYPDSTQSQQSLNRSAAEPKLNNHNRISRHRSCFSHLLRSSHPLQPLPFSALHPLLHRDAQLECAQN